MENTARRRQNETMLMLLVWVANALVVVFALSFAWLGNYMGVDFCIGAITATFIYNLAHRAVYGRWF